MPLSADDVIQENSGTSTGSTSVAVTLPSGTADGNYVFVFIHASQTVSTPASGFVLGRASASLYIYGKPAVAAETSWTFTLGTSGDASWYVREMSNVDVTDPKDVNATGGAASNVANGATYTAGTTTLAAGVDVVAFAAIGTQRATSGLTQSWSGFTNGFTEVIDMPSTGTTIPQLAVAVNYQSTTALTYSTTATLATTASAPGPLVNGVTQVYRATGSPVYAPITMMAGFEHGTHAGISNTGTNSMFGASSAPTGTWGTNYLIQASSARTSGYGLRIVNSASTGLVRIGIGSSPTTLVAGFNCRVVSATGTVVVATLIGTLEYGHLLYDSSTNKFGVRCTSTSAVQGTTQWESGTTPLNTWRWIDLRERMMSGLGSFYLDWRIETGTNTYTTQTTATVSSGGGSVSTFGLGSTTSQTATIDFDDVVLSISSAAHPIGPHDIRLLVPETTGASVSGTAANFNEFTANGTLAAFASTSGQRIDEVPPTISASSDGVVQVNLTASDYMEFPMQTYTCAADEIIGAVRMLCSEWGGTGTGTGTLGFRGWDGTTEITFVAASASYDADSLTAASATYPLWKTGMWTRTSTWTQAALNAAALRIGFSTDATPDMGISAAYLEVATRKAPKVRTLTVEDPISATVDLYVHPFNSATVSYEITNNDALRSVNFYYSLAGTPQTPVTVSPSSNQTLQLNADAFGDVSDVSLEPI